MVAEGYHVGAGDEQRLGHVGGKAETVRGVLAVDDGEIDAQIAAQLRQDGVHRVAAGAADNVAQKQDAHQEGSTLQGMMPRSVAIAARRTS